MLVFDLPMPVYNARKGMRGSLLKYCEPEVAPCQIWHHSWMNPERPPLTGAHIATGNLFHLAMENFELFQDTVKILPDTKRTYKPGCVGGAPGGQLEAILVLRAKLLVMPEIQEALAEGRPEVSIFSTYRGPYGSIDVRCRPDLLSDKVEIHWKTCSRMEYLGFHIERMRYIESLAFYRRVRHLAGLPPIPLQKMVFCQPSAPFEIKIIEPSAYFTDQDSKAWAYGSRALNRFGALYEQFGEEPWPDSRHTPLDIYTGSAGGPVGINGARNIALPSSYDLRHAA